MTVTGSTSAQEPSGDMGSDVVQSCLFHSPKCRSCFQQVLNLIRNSQYHIMNVDHLHKLGSAVCTCKRYRYHTILDEAMDDTDYAQTEQELKSHLTDAGCSKIVSVLEKLASIKLPKREHKKLFGYRRLVFLLHTATNRDYSYLEYSHHDSDIDDQLEEYSGAKFPFAHTFSVKFVSQYLRFLFGKHGRNIKLFSKKHGCVLKVKNVEKNYSYDVSPTSMTFEVMCREVGQCELVEADITKVMTEIQQKREAHDQKVLQYWTERSKRQQARRAAHLRNRDSSARSTALGSKEVKQENFSVKYQYLLKEKSQRKLDKAQPKPTLLEDGNTWCANCLTEYSKDAASECTYHSGFINGNRWSCCREEIEGKSRQDQKEQHKQTGCQTSRHIWKPHKRAKVRRQSGDFPVVEK